MVKYALLSLGVAGLLVLGEGLAPQVTWPTGQQERFVVRVPEDFPTIQAAIDAVAEGGTVLIGPGTYQEKYPDIQEHSLERSKPRVSTNPIP
jgi:pectin methylesterase-like acyl-CoA thioesterase